ncbi:hypothetical protein [Microcoleus sp. PH2017_22_RUC_O_B]|uniref:hypothetical protein n=1 Tax=Microcoleus sp. PH2017_22_RUC_O_B TaxID=2798833 RepID=UPI0025F30C27|nr:hypothetical protein [Microcoleus sp. PH2017_22_RUC_O_B]
MSVVSYQLSSVEGRRKMFPHIGVNLARKTARELIPWLIAKVLAQRTEELISPLSEDFSFEAGTSVPAGLGVAA